MEFLSDPQTWIALLTLTALEVVLGIDNVVFISIVAERLPEESQGKARKLGLLLAMITRILLLFGVTWLMRLDENAVFNLFSHGVTVHDLVLIIGGLFLIWKAVAEVHDRLEGEEEEIKAPRKVSFWRVVGLIVVMDIVFSFDSVITAIAMVDIVWVMVAAIVIAISIMMVFAGRIADFIDRHPTMKMLALSFLVLIGVNLVAEGFGQSIPKGYTYFAMAFSLGVELLNLKIRSKAKLPLRQRRKSASQPAAEG